MDQLMMALANFGGMGMLAAVLFYLHTRAMGSYREDLAAERKQCHEDHQALFAGHEKMMEQLVQMAGLLKWMVDHQQPKKGA